MLPIEGFEASSIGPLRSPKAIMLRGSGEDVSYLIPRTESPPKELTSE
jgi:hypothetical protein